MNPIPDYYTAAEIMEKFGWSRQQLHNTALRENWERVEVGTSHLYPIAQVHEFEKARIRTELAKKIGWSGRGLIRDAQWDIPCPECGAFAIVAPGATAEKNLILNGDPDRPWICENGHGNKGV